MIWTMKPTAKKLEDVETKVGNVGSTDLQSQVTTLNNKVGNVGSTDLQSQITTLNSKLCYNAGNKTDAELDAMTTEGIYFVWVANSSTSPGKGQWCFLIVKSPSSGYCAQTMISTEKSCEIASRYMNNGTWSNWFSNYAEKKYDLFYAYSDSEGQGDISDALLIDVSNPKGNVNRVGKIRGTTNNKPSDCYFGIRQVLAFSTSHYFVIIIGVDTSAQMGIWTNFYNTGSWTGWKRYNTTNA